VRGPVLIAVLLGLGLSALFIRSRATRSEPQPVASAGPIEPVTAAASNAPQVSAEQSATPAPLVVEANDLPQLAGSASPSALPAVSTATTSGKVTRKVAAKTNHTPADCARP
jgi:hypothetical protein